MDEVVKAVDEWVKATGAVAWNSSWHSELQSMVEQAFKSGQARAALASTPAQSMVLPEPVAWRTRYRSEPGMIGHYPWTYTERRRGAERPEHEWEQLHTEQQLRTLLAQAATAAAPANADSLATATGLPAQVIKPSGLLTVDEYQAKYLHIHKMSDDERYGYECLYNEIVSGLQIPNAASQAQADARDAGRWLWRLSSLWSGGSHDRGRPRGKPSQPAPGPAAQRLLGPALPDSRDDTTVLGDTEMKLIALCGAAGAGKDTVADMLPVRKLAFADALYREVAEAWGVEQHVLRCRETKELESPILSVAHCKDLGFRTNCWRDFHNRPRSPRQILQWWGDYRRAQDPDYFVARAWQTICDHMMRDESAVLTDVRFPNEAALVRQLGGQIWQIHRPSYEAGGTGHASDTDGSAFSPDRVVVNSGSLEDLRAAVLAAWEGKADAREALGSLIKERKK